MGKKIYYGGSLIESTSVSRNTRIFTKLLRRNNISEKNLIICKAHTQLDVYLQWIACIENNLLPIFVFSEFSKDNIVNWSNTLGIKAIVECKNGINEIYKLPSKINTSKFISEIETGSVIHLTSATTGTPKLVIRTKKQLDAELLRYSKYLDINEKDTILPIVPINHSFGFISGMLLSLKLNANLALPDVLLPRNVIQLSNNTKATMMLGVPYFYRKMLDVSNKYYLNNELRYIIASGGPMEEGLQREFKKRFGRKLLQQYGSTETGSLALGYSENDSKVVGTPIPGVKLKILKDQYGRPHLFVDTKDTIGGYVTENGIEWLGSEYETGDLADISSSDSIKLLGRYDDILIVDGKKVNKNYVISCIMKIEGITQADVFLEQNGTATELTCEYTGERKVSKIEFMEKCKNMLASFQIPKKFIYLKEMKPTSDKTWKTGF